MIANKIDYLNKLKLLEAEIDQAEEIRLRELEVARKSYEIVLHDLIKKEALYQRTLSELKKSCEEQISHLIGIRKRFRLRSDWLTHGMSTVWGVNRGKGWVSVVVLGMILAASLTLLGVFALVLVPAWLLLMLFFRFFYSDALNVLQEVRCILEEMPSAIDVIDVEHSVRAREDRSSSALNALAIIESRLVNNKKTEKYCRNIVLGVVELKRCLT